MSRSMRESEIRGIKQARLKVPPLKKRHKQRLEEEIWERIEEEAALCSEEFTSEESEPENHIPA